MPGDAMNIDLKRFDNSNTTTFAPRWTEADIAWWVEKMLRPHGIYPDDLGAMLSASVVESKHVELTDMKPKSDSFVIKVIGQPLLSGEIWWHQRKLDLKGQLFEAQRMIVPFADQDRGKGRLLMADLVDTAERLGIRRIEIEAEDVGRYAWARFGFLPDRTAWNYHVRIEARRRLQRSRRELGEKRYDYCASVLDQDNPAAIRPQSGKSCRGPTRFSAIRLRRTGTAWRAPRHWARLSSWRCRRNGSARSISTIPSTMAIFRRYVGR